MVIFKRSGVISYSHSVVTMAKSCIISEIERSSNLVDDIVGDINRWHDQLKLGMFRRNTFTILSRVAQMMRS